MHRLGQRNYSGGISEEGYLYEITSIIVVYGRQKKQKEYAKSREIERRNAMDLCLVEGLNRLRESNTQTTIRRIDKQTISPKIDSRVALIAGNNLGNPAVFFFVFTQNSYLWVIRYTGLHLIISVYIYNI